MLTLIENGRLVNEGRVFRGYLVLDGETIAKVGEGSASADVAQACDRVVDAEDAYVMPGAIDDHVHFRDPGLTHKADVATESRAAVAGGVTSYMDMPNCKPATVTLEALNDKYRRASEVSLANFSFYIGATNDNYDVLKQVDFSQVCGIKAFLGSSTGGMLLSDAAAARRLFSDFGTVIAIHSEDEGIINANRARLLAEQGGGDDLPLRYHGVIRSAEACYESTARAVKLAKECGTRLHVMHITTARELGLLTKGPVAEKKITAEACPAHLLFTEADMDSLGSRIKCNPSVKTAADRDALCHALRDGLVDVIGTDHAPHLLSEKQGGCLKAASGMPMVQFSLVSMLTLFAEPALVVEKMCHAPAALYRIKGRGYLREGYQADIAIVKQLPEAHTISDADVISRCGWTPLVSMKVDYQVVKTFVNGQLAFENGQINECACGQRLAFD